MVSLRRRPNEKSNTNQWIRFACKSLGLARLQLEAGLTKDAQATLDWMHGEIQHMRGRCEMPQTEVAQDLPVRSRAHQATEIGPEGFDCLAGCLG